MMRRADGVGDVIGNIEIGIRFQTRICPQLIDK